jgi:hypothetical protein
MSLPVATLEVPHIEDPPTETTVGRAAAARAGGVKDYLPVVALAAVVGAGLGSLFMALAPLLER